MTIPPAADRGPLSGFRIVDLSENMAGPFATMILGDQGADVVKVESLRGDQIRRTGSGSGGMAAYFANLNRSKRSIALDLLRPEGQAVLQRLFDDADVVIHAYRPQAALKLHIDEASVRTPSRPKLVYAEIVGFGKTGPMAGRAVYDHVVQAMSGVAALQSDPATNVPTLIRQGIIDKATGHVAAQSITAALLRRSLTGEGQAISITMLDVALNFLWPDGMMQNTAFSVTDKRPPAANTYRLTPTADGHISLMVLTDPQWAALHPALGLAPRGERTHPEVFARGARATRADAHGRCDRRLDCARRALRTGRRARSVARAAADHRQRVVAGLRPPGARTDPPGRAHARAGPGWTPPRCDSRRDSASTAPRSSPKPATQRRRSARL